MTSAFVITEYLWQGHKRLLLERLQGEDNGYRVFIVKRCGSLKAAQEVFLEEIPEGRKDYFNKIIEDYAVQHGIKTAQARPKGKAINITPAAEKKGKGLAKSK